MSPTQAIQKVGSTNILLGLLIACVSGFGTLLLSAGQDGLDEIRQVQNKIHQLELTIAKDYVTKDEMTASLAKLEANLKSSMSLRP